MAIAVPLLLANTAAGAAIAGAVGVSVGTLAVATSVVFQVTGVNDKINKAASKVFGEDLVKVANIAGAAYGAFNGGFSLDPAKEFLGIGEAAGSTGGVVDSLASLEAAPQITDASWMADGAANTAAITEAAAGVQPSVFDKLDFSQSNPVDAGQSGTDLFTSQPAGVDARVQVSNESLVSSPAQETIAVDRNSLADAAKPKATSNTATGLRAAGSDATSSGLGLKPPTDALAKQPSVFDKVFGKVGDKTIAGLIQGAAAGYGNAQQARLAEERARVNPSTIRGYTYRPTV